MIIAPFTPERRVMRVGVLERFVMSASYSLLVLWAQVPRILCVVMNFIYWEAALLAFLDCHPATWHSFLFYLSPCPFLVLQKQVSSLY